MVKKLSRLNQRYYWLRNFLLRQIPSQISFIVTFCEPCIPFCQTEPLSYSNLFGLTMKSPKILNKLIDQQSTFICYCVSLACQLLQSLRQSRAISSRILHQSFFTTALCYRLFLLLRSTMNSLSVLHPSEQVLG